MQGWGRKMAVARANNKERSPNQIKKSNGQLLSHTKMTIKSAVSHTVSDPSSPSETWSGSSTSWRTTVGEPLLLFFFFYFSRLTLFFRVCLGEERGGYARTAELRLASGCSGAGVRRSRGALAPGWDVEGRMSWDVYLPWAVNVNAGYQWVGLVGFF